MTYEKAVIDAKRQIKKSRKFLERAIEDRKEKQILYLRWLKDFNEGTK